MRKTPRYKLRRPRNCCKYHGPFIFVSRDQPLDTSILQQSQRREVLHLIHKAAALPPSPPRVPAKKERARQNLPRTSKTTV